jgi:hypothetical protein
MTYSVETTLPPRARDARDRLDRELHLADRRIGVITDGHERGLRLIVLTSADDAEAARTHALQLITAALEKLGLDDVAPQIEVGAVSARPTLPGGPRPADAPPLDYRSTTLPDGRVLRAACSGPLGEWFAYVDDNPGHLMAGRILLEVLAELFELPWGKKAPAATT